MGRCWQRSPRPRFQQRQPLTQPQRVPVKLIVVWIALRKVPQRVQLKVTAIVKVPRPVRLIVRPRVTVVVIVRRNRLVVWIVKPQARRLVPPIVAPVATPPAQLTAIRRAQRVVTRLRHQLKTVSQRQVRMRPQLRPIQQVTCRVA